jgi:Xaa-Pro aminopeptidase
VAHDIDALIRRLGFERPAFETIVASGPNSALPHARPGARVLQPGDGVVLDFGGVYDGYCVDLTRTVQLGDAGSDFRRVFAAVAEAQQAAIASIRPGIPASAVDSAARAVLGRYGLEEAFGHGTGHGLGLEVHEEPRIGRALAGVPDLLLEAGMVFTVEPGAYVEGVGGVRIEDDVLVTEDGCVVLTANGG